MCSRRSGVGVGVAETESDGLYLRGKCVVCDCLSACGKLGRPQLECEVLLDVSLGGIIDTTLLIRMGMWTSVPVVFGLRFLVVLTFETIYIHFVFFVFLLKPSFSRLLAPPLGGFFPPTHTH